MSHFLNTDAFIQTTFFTGYFERLITFMDFEGAALALIDDEQKDDVKELFDKLTETYIKIVDKFAEYFPSVGGIYFHDDWGSQRAPFFSPEVCMEMIVPFMRKLTDHIHSKGMYADLHCCGNVERQVPTMIAAGWDVWCGMTEINDTHMLYEKYGDKMIIGVMPDAFNPATTSEEEQKASAAKYIEQFTKPGKPSIISKTAGHFLTPAFRGELYRLSRIKYCE
jgi:uroporphyrinogen-III decarboxylase